MNIHDFYRPILRYFRTKRMSQFFARFEPDSDTSVLDIGGDPFNWTLLPEQTLPSITFANLYVGDRNKGNWLIADGCVLPFASGTFDIAYSNSVIEHLGTFEKQRQFALECQRVGMQFYVQTPNRFFFVEPHLITPIIHWLPRCWQRRLLRNFTIWGLITRPTQKQCDEFISEVRLLARDEIELLFPEAVIQSEQFLGLAKSLIAISRTAV